MLSICRRDNWRSKLRATPHTIQQYLQGLATTDLLCIDDIQCMLGIREWEEAWFNLYNQAAEAGSLWLVASDQLPSRLECLLPDLQSRLAWGLALQLQSLTDDQKVQALMFCASTRGLDMPETVAQYLLRHATREMAGLMQLFEKLDAAAWRV